METCLIVFPCTEGMRNLHVLKLSSYTGSPLNPFHVVGLLLYPPETLENLWFFDVLRGYRQRLVVGYQSTFFKALASDVNHLYLYCLRHEFAMAKPLNANCRIQQLNISADKEKK